MISEPDKSSLAASRSRFAAVRSPAAILIFILTTAFGLGLDLWSKAYSWRHLALGAPERDAYTGRLRIDSETANTFPGWLQFKVTVNEGAVFGMGQGKQTVFAIVSFLAIAFLGYLFITGGPRKFYQFVLGMLLAGVLGNLYDRMVYTYVRDMLYMLPGRKWPGEWVVPFIHYPGPERDVFPWIFNVADTLLCVGVGLMVIYSFFAPERLERDAVETSDATARAVES